MNVLTQYKAFTNEEVIADVGLHIGLRGVNITLRSKTSTEFFDEQREREGGKKGAREGGREGREQREPASRESGESKTFFHSLLSH